MEETKKLAQFVTATGFNDLPMVTVLEAKLAFLDWLAVTLGAVSDPTGDSMLEVVRLVGGEPQATVLGRNFKTSVLNATLLNGMTSHILDFDDTSMEFGGHPSVTLFPALLALAEWKRQSGRDFITAYVPGFEMGCRVNLGATPTHYLAGWHATSTIGHFSAAAGAGKLLGLTPEQLVFALGTAGTQAAGLKIVFGTSGKPFHAGKAAFNGLLSSLLAERGFTSVDNILEAPKGFWELYASQHQAEKALEGIGETWYILKNNHKFHASCHGTHAPIEAALAMQKECSLEVGKIDEIDIQVHSAMFEVAGKETPTTGLEGKFSIPYAVANALLSGDTGLSAFTNEKVNNPEVVALRDKIHATANDQLGLFEAEMKVHSAGKEYGKRFDMLQNPMTAKDMRQRIQTKFKSLAGLSLDKRCIEEIVDRVDHLERETNMADMAALLAGAKKEKHDVR